jgi:hypothetical protein
MWLVLELMFHGIVWLIEAIIWLVTAADVGIWIGEAACWVGSLFTRVQWLAFLRWAATNATVCAGVYLIIRLAHR